MLVRYTLTLEDHLAWYDFYDANSRKSVWSKVPRLGNWISARRRERFIKTILKPENRSAFGERALELSETKIREFGAEFDFFTEWKDLVCVTATEQHLFFVHPTMNAHIVPLRSFDTEVLRESFLSFATSRISPGSIDGSP